jgi:uncharacterized membrane protein YcaP (DUF421 family)
MVARPPNGGHAHQRGALDGATCLVFLLVLGRSSVSSLSLLDLIVELDIVAAHVRSEEKKSNAGARVP